MEDILITNTTQLMNLNLVTYQRFLLPSDDNANDPKEYISDTEEFNGSTIKESSHPNNDINVIYLE